MKMKFVLGGMILSAVPAFAAETCPDLSGHWVGACHADARGASSALASVQPLLEKAEENLEIKMVPASNPLACRLLTVGDRTLVIGGQHEERLVVPYEGGKNIVVSFADSGAWDQPGNALTSSASGKVEVGGQTVPFEVKSRYELRPDGHLYRTDESKGEGFDIKVNCEYQRQS